MFRIYVIILIIISCGCVNDSVSNSNNVQEAEIIGLENRIIRELKIYDQALFAATDMGLYRLNLSRSSEWISLGLDEYNISSVIKDNDRLLAASNDFRNAEFLLWQSEDNGKSWTAIDSDFGGEFSEPINALTANENISTIYGIGQFAIAESDDFGLTWKLLAGSWGAFGAGLQTLEYNSLSNEVWAGGQNAVEGFILFELNLHQQTSKLHGSLIKPPSTVTNILFDPENADRIIVGAEAGILETRDGGENWDILLEDHEQSRFFNGLEFDPEDSQTLYAAGWLKKFETPQPLDVYKSIDGGAQWDTLRYFQENKDLFGGVWSSVSHQNEEVYQIYLGLYKGGVVRINLPR